MYDEAGIFERTGVTPAQYPQYAALRGDTSDNLPGVPGIGEKTAAKLVSTYDTLEGIFEHLDDLPPKQRQNLGEFRDQVFHNREMSILRRDVPIDVDVDALQIGGWDQEAVRELFQQLEFRTLYPRLLEALGTTDDEVDVEATTLDVEVERVTTAKALAFAPADRSRRPEPRTRSKPTGREHPEPEHCAGSPSRRPTPSAYAPADLLDDAAVTGAARELLHDRWPATRRAPQRRSSCTGCAGPPT